MARNETMKIVIDAEDKASRDIRKIRTEFKKGGISAKKAAKQINGVNKRLRETKLASGGARKGMSKFITGIAAGNIIANAATAAFTGIISGLKGTIDAAAETEKQWGLVTSSLERHGLAVDGNIDRVRKFADEMQTLTGVADEDYGRAVGRLVDAGQDLDSSFALVTAAADVAAATGKDTAKVINQLSDAIIKGDVVALEKWTGAIDTSLSSADQFEVVLQRLNEKFGGAASANADSYAVRIDVMAQKFGDLQEKVGGLILGPLTDLANFGIDVLDDFLSLFEDNVVDVVKDLAIINKGMDTSVSTLNKLNRAYKAGKISIQQYSKASVKALKDVSDATSPLSKIEQEDLESLEALEVQFEIFAELLEDGTLSWDEFKLKMQDATGATARNLKTDIIDPYTEMDRLLLLQTERIGDISDRILILGRVQSTIPPFIIFDEDIDDEVDDFYDNLIDKNTEGQKKLTIVVNKNSKLLAEMVKQGLLESLGIFEDTGKSLSRIIGTDHKGQLTRMAQFEEDSTAIRVHANKRTREIKGNSNATEAAKNKAHRQNELEAMRAWDELELELAREQQQALFDVVSGTQSALDAVGVRISIKALDRLQQFSNGINQISSSMKILSSINKSFVGGMFDVAKSLFSAAKAAGIWIAQQVIMISKGIAAAAVAAAKAVASIPFIGPALAVAAAASVTAGLSKLIAGFDHPQNDAAARRWGVDAGRNFMMGFETETGAPQFGETVVGSLRGSEIDDSPFVGLPATQNITINANNATAQEIAEEIETLRQNNSTSITTDEVEIFR